MIEELFNFVLYNYINHGIAETCCSGCWLIIEAILFLLGHEWDKCFMCFIDICFFAPVFESFIENSRYMYIVVSKAKKLTVIDHLIKIF